MRNKRWYIIGAGVLIYVLLLFGLYLSESGYNIPAASDGSQAAPLISTPFKALWYSIATLTSVGYGDVYPVSPVGQAIGCVFMLFSLGLLAFVISEFLAKSRTRLFPGFMLLFSRRKKWYMFDGYTRESAAIARNLKKENPDCLVLFFGTDASESGSVNEGSRVVFSEEDLLRCKHRYKDRGTRDIEAKGFRTRDYRIHDRAVRDNETKEHASNNDGIKNFGINEHAAENNQTTVFYMSGNNMENYSKGLELANRQPGIEVCCMTEYEPEQVPGNLVLFNPYDCCARLYWRQHPVGSLDSRITFIGGGKYIKAILEQALLTNIISPDQHIIYNVYGDAIDFNGYHPYLSDVLSVNNIDENRDSIIFNSVPWYEDIQKTGEADRIIICEDDEAKAMEILCELQRYCPVTGEVHVRISGVHGKVAAFGDATKIFTPELVLKQKLNRLAIELHDIYRKSNPDALAPCWNELGGFLRRSNLAAADHLEMKVRILLGEEAAKLSEIDRYKRAYDAYIASRNEKADFYRKIEHARWMRFHSIYNWRYSPKRDNLRRLHPSMVSYEDIPEAEQVKDDAAWLVLYDAAVTFKPLG